MPDYALKPVILPQKYTDLQPYIDSLQTEILKPIEDASTKLSDNETVDGDWIFTGTVTFSGIIAANGVVTFSNTVTFTGATTVPEATVTAHEAALTILESQITDGTILARLASDETVTGNWSFKHTNGLSIYDSGGTDFAKMSHDGTDFNTDFTNTADWNLTGLSGALKLLSGRLEIGDGDSADQEVLLYFNTDRDWQFKVEGEGSAQALALQATAGDKKFQIQNSAGTKQFMFNLSTPAATTPYFEIYDDGGTDKAQFSHDGTDFNISFTNTTDWSISGLAGDVRLKSGAGLVIHDSTGADAIAIRHDGTDVNITNTGTTDINIDSVVVKLAGTLEIGTPPTYSESNVTTDRTYDANSTSIDELADVLGTLIADLRVMGIVN